MDSGWAESEPEAAVRLSPPMSERVRHVDSRSHIPHDIGLDIISYLKICHYYFKICHYDFKI